ncbi:MAG: PBSX family phage terminase large subunit [Bacteroidales bacterium]|nr:PBSX family phage terminase large subunit [Bacteroidales bacterium]
MKINLNIKKTAFNEVYFPHLLNYSHRYEVYYGGAGSGKSVFISQKLLIKSLFRKRKVLVIRKYGTTLKDSVFQLIVDTLKKWHLYSYCKINLSTYTITLPNGSIFLFKGMDDSEKIKSITDITDIWCEEATELSEDEFTQLDLRLRANEGDLQLICSFNPISKVNWVYNKWFAEDAVFDKDSTMILKTTYKDNRFLPEAYIAALEEKINSNPTYYKIYALGEFASLDKLVFNNWKVQDFNNADIKGELIIGLDFGFVNDISALVASVLDEENKKIYVFKEWGDTNKTNEELANIINSLGFSKSYIIADAAEPKSIEEIRRKGISRIKACTKGADSILHGIQKLQQYEIIIHTSCTGIATEFDNYSWQKDKKSNEYINKPIDAFNHFIDALRYSLQCISTKKLKTLNKASLGL